MNSIKKVLPQNAITVDIADGWVENWKKLEKINTKDLEGFIIPVRNLLNVLIAGRDKGEYIESIKAKIGYDAKTFKLILVALDKHGNEIVDSSVTNGPDGFEVIYDANYDFTKPCPPYIP